MVAELKRGGTKSWCSEKEGSLVDMLLVNLLASSLTSKDGFAGILPESDDAILSPPLSTLSLPPNMSS